jgi:hypothetical protein
MQGALQSIRHDVAPREGNRTLTDLDSSLDAFDHESACPRAIFGEIYLCSVRLRARPWARYAARNALLAFKANFQLDSDYRQHATGRQQGYS